MARAISSFLLTYKFCFPSNEFVEVDGRVRTDRLRMNVRYYPARDDLRAYCSDHDRLRHLVASLLHQLISPKAMSTRLKLHTASILRPDKKDILDQHLRQPQREG